MVLEVRTTTVIHVCYNNGTRINEATFFFLSFFFHFVICRHAVNKQCSVNKSDNELYIIKTRRLGKRRFTISHRFPPTISALVYNKPRTNNKCQPTHILVGWSSIAYARPAWASGVSNSRKKLETIRAKMTDIRWLQTSSRPLFNS